jgi:hypothetical protein
MCVECTCLCALTPRDALKGFPGLKVVDEPAKKQYPMPLTATGQYDVEVGVCSQRPPDSTLGCLNE